MRWSRVWPLLPLALGLGGSLLHLETARSLAGAVGFPLDDSWIHLTLARNLVETGQWAVNPGHAVGASTAPLWTLLLAAGAAVLGATPGMAQAVGIAVLLGGIELTRRLYLALQPGRRAEATVAAAVVAVLPSSLWGAVSGLEVPLALALTAAALLAQVRWRTASGWRQLAPPFLIGLATLARPEAALLFPLALLDAPPGRSPAGWLGRILAFALPLVPVAIFHLLAHGAPLPTTFYAKIHHSRHAAGGQGLFWALEHGRATDVLALGYRWSFTHLAMYWQTLLMANPLLAILVPAGLAVCFPRDAGNRGRPHLLVALALVLVPWLIGVFTPRPDYGEGDRYVAFLNPVVAVLATAGFAGAIRRLARPWAVGLALFALVPLGPALDRSVHRFAYGVKNIEELHVRLARWTRDALPAGATAAVHDIGALSFFGRLELLDLEGIASPEMARHKQDGSDRFRALEERRPDYLIVAPDWYPDLDRRREVFTPIHEQQIPPGENVVAAGSSLVVYRAHWPAAGP